ncbi:MAG: 4a-hydroxytetrahydrobiopterin dehydratase [Myxococcales bacterium]|nr:4a-hydroxytetrahydrobiopterin dehydratase [Myxococcales bacterium]
MTVAELADRACPACHEGSPRISGEALRVAVEELGGGWRALRDHHLEKRFPFSDFAGALAFVNRVGALAEDVNHHPDILLRWGEARISVWSHVIDGISETDVVFAAKCERLFQESKTGS